jgi:hypothetical protein
MSFTIVTNLQRHPVKHNTGFPLFFAENSGFPRPSSRRNVNDVTHRRRKIFDGAALQGTSIYRSGVTND